MSGPITAAGRDVLDATASDPFIPDTQKAALRDAALITVLAIEREARDAALAELRREVEGLPRLDMCDCVGNPAHPPEDTWYLNRAAVLAAIARLEEPRA